MRVTLLVALLTTFLLAGCSTVVNPLNWFDNDAPDEDTLEPIEASNPLIPERSSIFQRRNNKPEYFGTPIDSVSALTIERVPGGIIIRATGVSATQGPYNARLTPETDDEKPVDGILTYRLEAEYQETIGGPIQSREVMVARQLTDQEMGGARTIRVEALENSLERRR